MRHQYRFLAQPLASGLWKIDVEEIHHLKKVLRLNPGDTLEFFDGHGKSGIGTLRDLDGSITPDNIETTPPAPQRLVLAMGVLRPSHADEVIPQLVETGADEVIFFMQEGTSKQFISSKVQKRWERIALSSARQCKRPFLMKMNIFNTLEDVIGYVEDFCAKIQLAPGATTSLTEETHSSVRRDTCIVLGSEKGLLPTEEQSLERHGFKKCHLGQGILRATTAAILATGIAAISLIEVQAGGEGNEKQKKS
ncbi:MAG: 16S rRNA (uracil(1498)-N(3))-methyltransferase [Oligoflexales bacterium]